MLGHFDCDDYERGKPQVVVSSYQPDICSEDRQNRHKNNRNTNITIPLSGDTGTGKMHSGIPSHLYKVNLKLRSQLKRTHNKYFKRSETLQTKDWHHNYEAIADFAELVT